MTNENNKTHGIFISWDRAVTGREAAAAELFGMARAYFEKQRTAGKILSFEKAILGAHGGHVNGFMIARGDRDAIARVLRDEEFLELTIQGNLNLERFGVTHAYLNAAADDMVQRWAGYI